MTPRLVNLFRGMQTVLTSDAALFNLEADLDAAVAAGELRRDPDGWRLASTPIPEPRTPPTADELDAAEEAVCEARAARDQAERILRSVEEYRDSLVAALRRSL